MITVKQIPRLGDGRKQLIARVQVSKEFTSCPDWQSVITNSSRSEAAMNGIELVELISFTTSPVSNDPDSVMVRIEWLARYSHVVAATAMKTLRAYGVRARDAGVLGYSPDLRRMHQEYRQRQVARRRRARRAG